MGLTTDHIQSRLAQGDFETLFRDDLGWDGDVDDASTYSLGCGTIRRLARYDQATVVEVSGWPATHLHPQYLYGYLNRTAQEYSDPLVIWTGGIDTPVSSARRKRSLWCWRAGPPDYPHWHTQVMIQGQDVPDFAQRLLGLHRDRYPGDAPLYLVLTPPLPPCPPAWVEGFQTSWQSLTDALGQIPQATERSQYAMVLLTRLMAVAALQQRGDLGGDEWYLHNLFGQSQQQGQGRFFREVLQPLCHQGFSLPLEERPISLQERLGPIPFLPTGPFGYSPLDQRWGQVTVADSAFEPGLTWLGDVLTATAPGNLAAGLEALMELVVTDYQGLPMTTPEPVLGALCDRTLHATLLDWAGPLTGQRHGSLESLLMAISPKEARDLLEALGQLTLLDPACGSGRYLVAALKRLMAMASALTAVVALDPALGFPAWVQITPAHPASTALALYRHLATHSLYGVDLWPPAVELARLQLFLQGVRHTTHPSELATLPDVTLTIRQGNALLGLVQVDAERFDQIPPRGKKSAVNPDPAPLQGNLLQPLMAETYQAILVERQVRLEHYRSQTQLLAEAGTVPTYAQADFLRDRIEDLNQIAQTKLNHLLWSEASQQLGIRLQGPDPSGRRTTRLLAQADVEAATPFHWGFYFHHLRRDRGGFDVILSHFPRAAVQPSPAEFVATYGDLFQQKQVTPSTFHHHQQQVLTIDPDLTRAWASYRGQFSFVSQYFRRSGHYPHAGQAAPGQPPGRLYWSRLYLERSLQLLRPGGRCGVLLDPFWAQANSAPLRRWLETQTTLGTVVDLSNHRHLWGAAPRRTALSLLWLKTQGRTRACPYAAHTQAANALPPAALGALLQRLIHLSEQGGEIP